jgi:hypothetical protein
VSNKTRQLKHIFAPLTWPRFWINYLVALVLTSFVPVVRMEVRTGDGKVLGEQTWTMYQIYRDLLQHPTAMNGWKYLAIHTASVFAITAFVWTIFWMTASHRVSTSSTP